MQSNTTVYSDGIYADTSACYLVTITLLKQKTKRIEDLRVNKKIFGVYIVFFNITKFLILGLGHTWLPFPFYEGDVIKRLYLFTDGVPRATHATDESPDKPISCATAAMATLSLTSMVSFPMLISNWDLTDISSDKSVIHS